MVREIVHIQIGQCGNRIGSRFFEMIANEHLIHGTNYGCSDDYLYGIKTYYNENIYNEYEPRAISFGYDPSDLSKVFTGENPQIYIYNYEYEDKKMSFFKDNWAHSYYFNEYEDSGNKLDIIRKEVEKCDCLQGFQLVHSCSGGIGSGLSSYIIENVRDEYPDRKIITYSVFPSQELSESLLEPYNFILTIPYLLNFVDEVICIDNEAVFNIYSDYMKSKSVSYGDLNYLISLMMSNFSCPFRFKNQVNSDLNRTVMNLVLFPKFHFIIPSLSTIVSRGSTNHYNFKTKDLVSNLFNCKTFFADCDMKNSVYLDATAQFRGDFSLNQIGEEFKKIEIPEIPNFKISACQNYCYSLPKTSSLFFNSPAINDVFCRINSYFQKYYEKRPFMHLFHNEGLGLYDFDESYEVMNELISLYKNIE